MKTSTTVRVPQNQIIAKVMIAISGAKMEILATMSAAEELVAPLPRDYFNLLLEKMENGVRVRRLVFGSIKNYGKVASLYKQHSHPNLLMLRAGAHASRDYKRMILIDRKILFFKHKEAFYHTTEKKLIKKYKEYFENSKKIMPRPRLCRKIRHDPRRKKQEWL